MCGIAGIVGDGIESERRMQLMLSSMKHRGPDYSGIEKISERVCFGHNRLAIIDLNASSNQPFISHDRRYYLTYNGEIYNYLELKQQLSDYPYRTHSDTEVLLAAFDKWGHACLEKLIGMFSFALWDNHKKVMFAARDRFGVKPFYYSVLKETFLFASEIKALWAAGVPRTRNEEVWSSFLVYGSYGTPSQTFWQGVSELPGGHFLIRDEHGLAIKQWYRFDTRVESAIVAQKECDEAETMQAYSQLLTESIRLRFRADVPVGFNVSGGLDSSLLLSLIKESFPDNRSIEGFTFYTGDPSYDELPWVKVLMEATQYPLRAVRLTPEEVPGMTEHMARIQDEPFGGIPTLAYSVLFKEARKRNTIVLLDGQGIDEAWAGYDYYQSNNASIVQGVTSSPVRPGVLDEDFRRLAVEPDYPKPFQEPLLNVQYRDLFFTKIPRALRFNDRASMMHSTELREPFLDHRLVEMAFALPASAKINRGVGKYWLRTMTGRRLPDTITHAPKRPLQTPQREWLGGELQGWTNEKVGAFSTVDGINKESLLREWKQYREQGSDNSFYIWQFINSACLLAPNG